MIKNVSKNRILAKESKLCRSILSKTKGLMFSAKPKPLVFTFSKEERWSLHMLFVFFPIDVLWLNKDKKVVDIRQKFRPFSLLAKPQKKARYIIELPAGAIKNSRTEIGDKILF